MNDWIYELKAELERDGIPVEIRGKDADIQRDDEDDSLS